MQNSKFNIKNNLICRLVGLLGFVFPWLTLFSAGQVSKPLDEWVWSISATYHMSPAFAIILVPAGIGLILYRGYNLHDKIVNVISGLCALCVVIFPAKFDHKDTEVCIRLFPYLDYYVSHCIHCSCVALGIVSMIYNVLFLFTKSVGKKTARKLKRNLIYKTCGVGMFLSGVLIGIFFLFDAPGYCLVLFEILEFEFFGIAWLVKGETFPFLNDKKVRIPKHKSVV